MPVFVSVVEDLKQIASVGIMQRCNELLWQAGLPDESDDLPKVLLNHHLQAIRSLKQAIRGAGFDT
jgi:hypothetical protein